jgi:PAS domain S-box-containing protein
MKKYYFYIFLGILLSGIVFIFMIAKIRTYSYDSELKQIEQNHQAIQERVTHYVDQKDTFIKMIPKYDVVQNFLNTQNDIAQHQTQKYLHSLVLGNEMIIQLRILDTKGQELVRIDRTQDNKIRNIKKEDLQNKFNRYYFQEFSKLDKGNVGYSDIDLNEERNKIEVPWRPTLRLGTPIFIDEKRVGMVIINFNMKSWLQDLSKLTLNNFYLVDKDGYFIYHPQDEWKWSRHQSLSLKINSYFKVLNNDKVSLSSFREEDNLFAKKINFFNNQQLIAVYEPKIPVSTILFNKAFEIFVYISLAMILVLTPVIGVVVNIIKKLQTQKENLKMSQDFLSAVFSNTFDAIFVINHLAIIKDANLTALSLFGYERSELVGKNIKLLIPEPDRSKHDMYVKSYVDDGHKSVIGEERYLYGLHKDQHEIPIVLSVTKMEQNGEIFFIGSIKDYTQLKLAKEKQAEQESLMLEQSKFAAMGEMLSAIAHQWRQPLNSIGLIVQDLLSAEKHKELNLEYLTDSTQKVMAQLNLMSSTIDEFRNFYKKDNVAKEFNVLNAVQEVYSLYWAQFKAHDIRFELMCKNESGILEECENISSKKTQTYIVNNLASELKQVLLNIVANAKDSIVGLKDAAQYEKEVLICLESLDNEIKIEISDRAGGINEDYIKRIFEPYFTTKEMGTGIGLFIVKTLVEKHLHGTITCSNYTTQNDGNTYAGALFTILVPKKISIPE